MFKEAMVFIFIYTSGTGEGNGTPLQYSCLENPIDRGAWQAAVHGIAKSWTGLSDFTFFLLQVPREFIPEKAMAPHSSTLAWKIPQTEGPGGLQSMGLQRVGHDLATKQQQTLHVLLLLCYYFYWGDMCLKQQLQVVKKLPTCSPLNSCSV